MKSTPPPAGQPAIGQPASNASHPAPPASLLNIEQVAAKLGVSRQTLYQWVRQGRIQAINLGRKKPVLRFAPIDVDAFIESRKMPSASVSTDAALPAGDAGSGRSTGGTMAGDSANNLGSGMIGLLRKMRRRS